MLRTVFLTAFLCAAIGCSGSSPSVPIEAQAWPEADALFRSDPRWLGAGHAYSVDLGGARSLWLFSNTFVDPSGGGDRDQAGIVANSVGLQTGLDPSTAMIDFFWGGTGGPFFPGAGDTWLWPLHGIRIGNTLTLFFSRLRVGTPFPRLVESVAYRIDNPDAQPDQWTPVEIPLPALAFSGLIGVSLVRRDGFVYAYVDEESEHHPVYLLRWTEASFLAGSLLAPEWLSDGRWVPHAVLGVRPRALFGDGAGEFSVSARDGGFVQVQSKGRFGALGASQIGARIGDDLGGPWSPFANVFRPEEAGRSDVIVNSGKGHPQLLGADLVATYVPQGDPAEPDLLFPRFVRLTFTMETSTP